MNVGELILALRGRLGVTRDDAPDEGLIAGERSGAVARIVVCLSPSAAVLREAGARPNTLVITRQHPYYAHERTYWSNGVEQALERANDPVLLAKRELVRRSGLAIYRLSSVWDEAEPKRQARALAETLGWAPGDSGGGRKVICNIPPTSLLALTRHVGSRLDTGPLRVIGPRDLVVRRVALAPDFLELTTALDVLAAEPSVDAIVAGEACEWEAAPLIKDTVDIGQRRIGAIFAGTQPTQEPGARAMSAWIAQRFPSLPVTFADAPRPVRRLEARS